MQRQLFQLKLTFSHVFTILRDDDDELGIIGKTLPAS